MKKRQRKKNFKKWLKTMTFASPEAIPKNIPQTIRELETAIKKATALKDPDDLLRARIRNAYSGVMVESKIYLRGETA